MSRTLGQKIRGVRRTPQRSMAKKKRKSLIVKLDNLIFQGDRMFGIFPMIGVGLEEKKNKKR